MHCNLVALDLCPVPDFLDVAVLFRIVVGDIVRLEEECAYNRAAVVVLVLFEQIQDEFDSAFAAGTGKTGVGVVIEGERCQLFDFIGLEPERWVCRWFSIHS